MLHNRVSPAILVIAALAISSSASAQQTVAADRFVDSAGVNVHLHYDRTIYGTEFPLIKSRLLELGVRHVRDGLVDSTWWPYYDRHNELGRAGIKGLFIAGPNDSTQLLAEYPSRMRDAFEAYEAPNEYDRSPDPNWVQTMTQVLTRLRSMRDVPAVAHFPVIGPSLVDEGSYAELGDVSHLFDFANLHNYLGGRNPGTIGWGSNGYGSIAWNMNLARRWAPGKAIITTETGYKSNLSLIDSVPQQVAGRYAPRVLLEQFRAGILRTYIYELADHSTSHSYGLLNPDGSPKAAFTAVKNLLTLLADPGPAFTPQNLGYSVEGGTTDLHHMVFQKRDGRYFLALWIEKPSYDVDTKQLLPASTQDVTVTLPAPMRVVRSHRWQGDGSVSTATAVITTASVPVSVFDTLTVIELAQPTLAGILPGVPGILSAVVDFLSVLLRWQAPTDGAAPTGYTIEAASTPDFSNATAVPIGAVTELAAPNVLPGMYFLRVRAANGAGQGAPSNVAQLAVGSPAAPQLVAQQTNANPIALAWSGGAGADRYVLSAGSSPGASDLAVVDMGRATQVVAPIPPGVRFYVRVAAVNGFGVAASNEVSFAVGHAEVPGAPSLAAAQVVGRHVKLTWTAGAGGALHNYVLAVGSSPGAANLGLIPVGLARSVEGDLPSGGPLFVRVFAQNGAGSAASNEISFSVP